MRIEFVQRDNGPERLVCEAEIHFEEEGLKGLKLVGFSLWSTPEGEVYVTFPSRAFGIGTDRRYFDYVRPSTDDSTPARNLKNLIKDAYKKEAL